MFMKNAHDAEDMTHNTFVKLMNSVVGFESEEHEKAWLIRTASNTCKDSLKSAWAKRVEIPDTLAYHENAVDDTLEQVLALPEKYKIPIYLFYYEGYKTAEIAKMLGKPEVTIRGIMHRGRKLLKLELENNYGQERINSGV